MSQIDRNFVRCQWIQTFSGLCDIAFPGQKTKIKDKALNTPWTTKDPQRSFKRNQKLYEKFLQKRAKPARKDAR